MKVYHFDGTFVLFICLLIVDRCGSMLTWRAVVRIFLLSKPMTENISANKGVT